MQVANLIAGAMIQNPRPADTRIVDAPPPLNLAAQIDAAWQRARRHAPLIYAADTARAEYLHPLAQYQRDANRAAADGLPADAVTAKRIRELGTETLAFLTALAALGWSDLPAVAEVFEQNGRPVSDAARPIFERHPALQRWDDRRQAVAAAHDAGVAAVLERRRETEAAEAAEVERQAPARLLAALRGRGFVMGMDAKGTHLTASHAASLTAEELAALHRHKPALLLLLKADAEAAKPVVVA